MTELFIEIVIIVLLILANGLLAMSEIAIISARKSRLQHLSERGNTKARTALEIAKDPNDFLSTVQIGITLVGILTGAFGGATIARHLEIHLRSVPYIGPFSQTISLGLVVLAITYLSLVVGELVPKRISLARPEGIAVVVARPMRALSKLARPAVWALSASTEFILKLITAVPANDQSVSEEDIKILVKQAAQIGILSPAEKEMIHRVILLGDRRVSSIMTQRADIEWLDLSDPDELNRRKILESTHSYFPVGDKRLSNFEGIVAAKDLLVHNAEANKFDIKANLKQTLVIPETMKALTLLEQFKKSIVHLAIVVDEYGGIAGLVTLNDVLEAIVGDIPTPNEPQERSFVQREDGSWLIDGMVTMNEFVDSFVLPAMLEDGAEYDTVAGYVLAMLGRIPNTGDAFEIDGFRFEVIDMDGKRIDKILFSPPTKH